VHGSSLWAGTAGTCGGQVSPRSSSSSSGNGTQSNHRVIITLSPVQLWLRGVQLGYAVVPTASSAAAG
jgi:hypothetical protein